MVSYHAWRFHNPTLYSKGSGGYIFECYLLRMLLIAHRIKLDRLEHHVYFVILLNTCMCETLPTSDP